MSHLTYPFYPVATLTGFVLVLIPLPWHFQAWNSGTCFFMMWAALACINQFVNSVVWHGNTTDVAPIWCEISIRIMFGASVGVPAASLCINRRLYHIANTQTVTVGVSEKRRAVLIDSLICVLFPMIFIALQFIVQGHRYNIIEDYGCFPALFNTIPTFFIASAAPLLIGCISAIYCVLTLRAFSRRRLEFNQFLRSNNASLTLSRYFRLMALATTELCLTIPLSIFSIWLNAIVMPIAPYISWADTHYHYFRVERIPAIILREQKWFVVAVNFNRWVVPACALIFFAFFGFAAEAKRNYKKAFLWFSKILGMQRPLSNSPKGIVTIGQLVKRRTTTSNMSSDCMKLPLYSPPPTTSTYAQTNVKRTDSYVSQTSSNFLAESAHNSHGLPATPALTAPLTHDAVLSPRQLAWQTPTSPSPDRRRTALF